jgi:hypothetical protein
VSKLDPNARQLGVIERHIGDTKGGQPGAEIVRTEADCYDWDAPEIKRKVHQRKHKEQRDSVYREGKTAAHTTRGGLGQVARALRKK